MCAPGGGGGGGSNLGVPTPQEVVEAVDDAYQGSDIDTTLEGVQEAGELMADAADSIISGEPKGGIKGAQDDMGKVQEAYEDFGEDVGDFGDTLQDSLTDAITNTVTVGTNASNQLQKILGIGKSGPDDDQFNAMASIEGDPRLASLLARMRKRRKQGKSQLRKGGGLYIPLKAGIQVQT